ncbi:MAG: hypothetical protein P8182_09760 [Deltaproteobacteria bacterium]
MKESELSSHGQRDFQTASMPWAHDDINSFQSQYVDAFLPASDPARSAIAELLTILDEQGDCPSTMPESVSGEEHVSAKISLRAYSLETARIAFDMIRRGHRDPEMLMGKILIIALGHQVGVISDADILGGVSAKSVLLLDALIQDLPYKESIVNAVRTFRENNVKSDEARILKAASSAAGKKECERTEVLSKTRREPFPDIEQIKRAIQAHPDREGL